MSTFPLARLAPELQAMVWKEALNNEAKDRIALVHQDSLRVVPSKCLISPLKAVNRGIRKLALKHYNVRLVVIKPTLDLAIMDAKTWYSRGDGYYARTQNLSMPEDWERYVRYQTQKAVWEALNADQDDAHTTAKGCVYLSSHSDTFLLSFGPSPPGKVNKMSYVERDMQLSDCCVTAVAHSKISAVLNPTASKTHKAPQRCMTAKLPPSACRLIANVIYASPRYDSNLKPWPRKLYYPSATVAILWMAQIFPRMRSPATGARYRTLEDTRSEFSDFNSWEAFVFKVLQEGVKSLNFREWQIEDHLRDPDGWRIWKPAGT